MIVSLELAVATVEALGTASLTAQSLIPNGNNSLDLVKTFLQVAVSGDATQQWHTSQSATVTYY